MNLATIGPNETNQLTLPSKTGTLAITSDIPTKATSSALGTVMIGSTISDTTGYTKCPIDSNGVIYYKDTNTTYTLGGLMGISAIGSSTQPIYWDGSTWQKTTYTLGKSVPSDAVFTDTTYTLAGLMGTDAIGSTTQPVYWTGSKWANATQTSVSGSSGSCTGNAATATKATQDGDGNTISSTYLKLSGGTMTGKITIPNTANITQTQNSGSNYTILGQWYKGGTSQATYNPEIGQHNTGGTAGTGSICILPYATESEPWQKQVGLYIAKGELKLDGTDVLTQSNYTSYAMPKTWANNTLYTIGDDVSMGDGNVEGCLVLKGLNGATGIQFNPYSGSTSQKISIDGSGTMSITGTVSVPTVKATTAMILPTTASSTVGAVWITT
jgi:hypothetical protein